MSEILENGNEIKKIDLPFADLIENDSPKENENNINIEWFMRNFKDMHERIELYINGILDYQNIYKRKLHTLTSICNKEENKYNFATNKAINCVCENFNLTQRNRIKFMMIKALVILFNAINGVNEEDYQLQNFPISRIRCRNSDFYSKILPYEIEEVKYISFSRNENDKFFENNSIMRLSVSFVSKPKFNFSKYNDSDVYLRLSIEKAYKSYILEDNNYNGYISNENICERLDKDYNTLCGVYIPVCDILCEKNNSRMCSNKKELVFFGNSAILTSLFRSCSEITNRYDNRDLILTCSNNYLYIANDDMNTFFDYLNPEIQNGELYNFIVCYSLYRFISNEMMYIETIQSSLTMNDVVDKLNNADLNSYIENNKKDDDVALEFTEVVNNREENDGDEKNEDNSEIVIEKGKEMENENTTILEFDSDKKETKIITKDETVTIKK